MFGNQKKLKSFILSFQFIVIVVIISFTAWLFLLDNFKEYRAETSILLIPKSERVAAHSDKVLGNLAKISEQLSFYDAVLSQNNSIVDPFHGLTKDERKKGWNDSFKIRTEKETSILLIEVSNKNREEAIKITEAATASLFKTASKYYNVKTDVDFRIIEEPVVKTHVRGWTGLIFTSVLVGFSLSLAIIFLLFSLYSIFRNKKRKANPQEEWKKKLDELKKDMTVNKKEDSVSTNQARKSAAPENLPIVNDIPEAEDKIDERNITGEFGKRTDEPTDEEYRERLNQLLSGDL